MIRSSVRSAGEGCSGEADGIGAEEVNGDDTEHPFEVDAENPISLDTPEEFVAFLNAIDAEQCRRGVPEVERVNPRRGLKPLQRPQGRGDAGILSPGNDPLIRI